MRQQPQAHFLLLLLGGFASDKRKLTSHVLLTVLTSEIRNKLVQLHSVLVFQTRIVLIRVQHDDRERQHEHGVRIFEPRDYVAIAATIAVAECLRQTLDFLSFAGQFEIRDELTQRHVDLHPGQIDFVHVASAADKDRMHISFNFTTESGLE